MPAKAGIEQGFAQMLDTRLRGYEREMPYPQTSRAVSTTRDSFAI